MADKLMRAQVTVVIDQALPENYIMNTFYFDGDDGLTDSIYHAHVEDMLTDFYQAIDEVVFGAGVGGEATVKIYDMRDPEPRVPEHQFSIPLTPNAATDLPHEVAICMSFAADPISGVNPQRLRGRVFLGPVANNQVVLSAGQPYITSAARTAIATAGAALLVPRGEEPGPKVSWAIYSPTTDATSSIDDAFNDVQSGWVDNAFDTQRRRGPKATERELFS